MYELQRIIFASQGSSLPSLDELEAQAKLTPQERLRRKFRAINVAHDQKGRVRKPATQAKPAGKP